MTTDETKEELTLAEVRRQDPFSDSTRRERRTLLWFASIGIFVWLTDTLPEGISAIGIEEIDSSQQVWIAVALAGVVLYLGIGFFLNAWSEYQLWKKSLQRADEEANRQRDIVNAHAQYCAHELEQIQEMEADLHNLTDSDEARMRVIVRLGLKNPELQEKLSTLVIRNQERYVGELRKLSRPYIAKAERELRRERNQLERRKVNLEGFESSQIFAPVRLLYDLWFPLIWTILALSTLAYTVLKLVGAVSPAPPASSYF